jgi:hypothetical protein
MDQPLDTRRGHGLHGLRWFVFVRDDSYVTVDQVGYWVAISGTDWLEVPIPYVRWYLPHKIWPKIWY